MRLILWSLLLLPTALLSQSPLLGVQDARARAAGGTGVAAEGLLALWRNPAGLASSRDPRVGVNYEQRFAVSELGIASAGVSYAGFGLRLASLSFDGYAEQTAALAYGRSLGERSRLGASFGWLGRRTAGYPDGSSLSLGLGAQYDLLPSLTVGATVDYADGLRTVVGLRYLLNPSVTLALEGGWEEDVKSDWRFGAEYLPHTAISVYLGAAPVRGEITLGAGYRITDGLRATVAVAVQERLGGSPLIGLVFAPSVAE